MVIYFPLADLSCCGLERFKEGLSLIPWLASSCNKACFFSFLFFTLAYPGRVENTKPCDILKVRQTWPVDTDLLEFPNSFHHILVQLREA